MDLWEKAAVVTVLFIFIEVFIEGVERHDFCPTPLKIELQIIASDYNPASFFSISALSVFSHEKESSDLPK